MSDKNIREHFFDYNSVVTSCVQENIRTLKANPVAWIAQKGTSVIPMDTTLLECFFLFPALAGIIAPKEPRVTMKIRVLWANIGIQQVD